MPDTQGRYTPAPPELVNRALELAESVGFRVASQGTPYSSQTGPSTCLPEVGRLLLTLAAARPGGRIVEIGTGVGVGTAWLASGMRADAMLLSVEINTELSAAVIQLFADRSDIEIRAGDWQEVLIGELPADLLFLDAAAKRDLKEANWGRLTDLVTVGGHIVLDDLTPVELWPLEWHGSPDPKREFAFQNPRVVATEVRTTPTTAVLLVTRVE